jgi:hypothetical protein
MKRSFLDYIPIFKVDINSIVTETLKNKGIQQQIIDLNQSQLYDEGLDSEGKFIHTISGDPYTEYTKQRKQDKGQATDHVTLYDEGTFYNSMAVKEVSNGVEVIADFSKGGSDIRDNFQAGFDPLGLTKESLLKLKEWLFLDLFGQFLKKSMGL